MYHGGGLGCSDIGSKLLMWLHWLLLLLLLLLQLLLELKKSIIGSLDR